MKLAGKYGMFNSASIDDSKIPTVASTVNKLPKNLQKEFYSNWWILVDPATVGVPNPSQEQRAHATERVNTLLGLAARV